MIRMKDFKKPVTLFIAIPLFCASCTYSRATADLSLAPEFVSKTYYDYTKNPVNSEMFYISDGYSNSMTLDDAFGCTWYESQVSTNSEEGMSLKVEKTDDISLIKDAERNPAPQLEPYLGAEIRTNEAFTYGFFDCYMKVAKGNGLVTAFFTYTGPSENQPHDEIDFEFLGKDTTQVQFNYFSGNDVAHECYYRLGFDASEDYHHYGFYWGLHEITWYVDFVPVYRVADIETPKNPCKVFNSLWSVNSHSRGMVQWAKKVNDADLPSKAYVKDISIAPLPTPEK